MAHKKARTRRAFDVVKQLKSGRYRARCQHPQTTEWVRASNTFPAQIDAEGWLAEDHRLIDLGVWVAPGERERRAVRRKSRGRGASSDLRAAVKGWGCWYDRGPTSSSLGAEPMSRSS